MNRTFKLVSTAVLSTGILMAAGAANAETVEGNHVYAGLELGMSTPVVDHFDYVDELNHKTRIGLKRSSMYGGKLGYSFYPNMAIEISGTHQPKYDLTYKLPAVTTQVPVAPTVTLDGTIPETSGRTKVKANVFTANLVYKFDSVDFAGIKPYVIGGAGIAIVEVSPTSSSAQITLANGAQTPSVNFFRVNKTKTNCPAYQAGVGLFKEIGNNIEVDVSAKLQVVQGIKIKYDTFKSTENKFVAQKPIKKTIGVAEFALGFTYKLGL